MMWTCVDALSYGAAPAGKTRRLGGTSSDCTVWPATQSRAPMLSGGASLQGGARRPATGHAPKQ